MKLTFFIIAQFLIAQFSCKSLRKPEDSNNGVGLAPNQPQGHQQGDNRQGQQQGPRHA